MKLTKNSDVHKENLTSKIVGYSMKVSLLKYLSTHWDYHQ